MDDKPKDTLLNKTQADKPWLSKRQIFYMPLCAPNKKISIQ